MTTVVDPLVAAPSPVRDAHDRGASRDLSIALLGLGQVGSAFARLVATAPPELGRTVKITGALVSNTSREAPAGGVPLTADPRALLDGRPDVVVEVLGGLEPARTLVLEALARGIPVVTANKSLLAAHGDELLEAAWRARVPLRYEASVVAGVPFLGTFDRRPLAAAVTELAGIVNGTSHFILSKMETGCEYSDALADAQRLGYAERDPFNDIAGIDAAEKLTILIRQFSHSRVTTAEIPIEGIDHLLPADLAQARELGGAIKPVVHADLGQSGALSAFVAPAFVSARHPLASLSGVANGVWLKSAHASLFYSGPGAGPAVTATTLLDDVAEALTRNHEARPWCESVAATVSAPAEGRWLVRLTAAHGLPSASDTADLLSSHDIWTSRITETTSQPGSDCRWLVALPCAKHRLARALESLERAAGCEVTCLPVLEDPDA
jgi:homoserine dehydrogenase